MPEPRRPARHVPSVPFVVLALVLGVLGVLLATGRIRPPVTVAVAVHAAFNYVEAVFWAATGIAVLVVSRKRPAPAPRLGAVAAVTFLAFGASDLVETQTGAWYSPWWLFLWKAACVATLLLCLLLHERSRRGARSAPDRGPEPQP